MAAEHVDNDAPPMQRASLFFNLGYLHRIRASVGRDAHLAGQLYPVGDIDDAALASVNLNVLALVTGRQFFGLVRRVSCAMFALMPFLSVGFSFNL
jgi:hypothetical protein